VLNVIDAVSGDDRFLQIRKRKPKHSTLKMVEARASEARKEEDKAAQAYRTKYSQEEQKIDEKAKKAYAELQRVVDDLKSKQAKGEFVDPGEFQGKLQVLALQQDHANRESDVAKERLKLERDKNLAAIQRERDQLVKSIQNENKLKATIFPPIPPLLVGLVVWVRRRIREREGVSRSRMK
jgi:ABC-2 type transport system permease protein